MVRSIARHTFYLLASFLVLFAGNLGVQAQTAVQISPVRFDINADGGQTKVDTIKLTNNSPDPQTFQVTVEDFYASDEFGKPSFRTPDANAKYSISTWITPSITELNVPANATKEIQFTVNIPADAEPGGHYGALFFSPPAEQNGQVAVQGRIGALLFVNVSGDVVENTTLQTFGIYDKEVDFAANSRVSPLWFFDKVDVPFALRLQNTGSVHARPTGTIEIYDMWGNKLKNVGIEKVLNTEGVLLKQEQVDYLPINPEQGVVLPETYRTFRNLSWDGFAYERFNNETGRVELIKDRPWNIMGQFKGVLTLQLGEETITREVTFWIIPWQPILLLIIVIVAVIFLIRFGLGRYRRSIETRILRSQS